MTLDRKTPTACSQPAWEPQHAFVVQFSPATDAGVRGRVEHVFSGQVSRFATEADLLEFMRSVLKEVSLSDGCDHTAQIHGGLE